MINFGTAERAFYPLCYKWMNVYFFWLLLGRAPYQKAQIYIITTKLSTKIQNNLYYVCITYRNKYICVKQFILVHKVAESMPIFFLAIDWNQFFPLPHKVWFPLNCHTSNAITPHSMIFNYNCMWGASGFYLLIIVPLCEPIVLQHPVDERPSFMGGCGNVENSTFKRHRHWLFF